MVNNLHTWFIRRFSALLIHQWVIENTVNHEEEVWHTIQEAVQRAWRQGLEVGPN